MSPTTCNYGDGYRLEKKEVKIIKGTTSLIPFILKRYKFIFDEF